MELSKDNLIACGLNEGLANLFGPNFKIYKCYKYLRTDIIKMIKQGSEIIEKGQQKFYWLKAPFTYLVNNLQWSLNIDEPDNAFKEKNYVIRREEIVSFHLFSEELLDALCKTDIEASVYEVKPTYDDNKEMCRFTSKYSYMKLSSLLPGNETLRQHVAYIIDAVVDKNEDYKLIHQIYNS